MAKEKNKVAEEIGKEFGASDVKITSLPSKKVLSEYHKKEAHPYMENLEMFIGKTVEVKNLIGEKIRGTCLGICKNNLNVILETEEDIIVIKNMDNMRRSKK